MKNTTNNTITIIYIIVAVTYFINATYSYYNKIEDQILINIGLGVMFLILSFVCRVPAIGKGGEDLKIDKNRK